MQLKEYLDKNIIDKKKFCKKAGINARTLDNMLKGRDVYLSIALKIYYATDGTVAPFDLRPEHSASDRIRNAHLGKKRVDKIKNKVIKEQQQQNEVANGLVEIPSVSIPGASGDQLPVGDIHVPPIVDETEKRDNISSEINSENRISHAETEILRSLDPIG